MKRLDLLMSIQDGKSAIEWGQDWHIPKKDPICPKCGSITRFMMKKSNYRCFNHLCGRVISVTANTLFQALRLIFKREFFYFTNGPSIPPRIRQLFNMIYAPGLSEMV